MATPTPPPREAKTTNHVVFFGKDSEWFWAMLQVIGIPITLLVIRRQVVLQRQASALDALRSLKDDWVSPSMIRAQEECCDNFLNPGRAPGTTLDEEKIGSFYELLGLYVRLGVLDKELCWNVFSYDVEHYWLILEPKLAPLMKNDKTLFKEFKQFYELTLELTKRHGGPATRTRDELTSFCQRLITNRGVTPAPSAAVQTVQS